MNACGNCFFSAHTDIVHTDKDGVVHEQRTCYRFPPTLFMTDDGMKSYSPMVHKNAWCGEWKSMPQQPLA